ncbi:MAG: hypothetical protein KDE34_28010, partial [Anaerolineales bacterium]|nr:hypothetical protein [Anaerolineales bacterium]
AMFMPVVAAMGMGQAHAGTGDQKGSVNETKEGMGQQAEAGRAGVELTSMGVAVSKQRQGETLRAQQQTRFEEKRLRDLDARLAADQDKALEGQEEFAMLTDGSGSTQDEIIAEQDSLTETYAEANDYAQSWADEHYAVRQELFGDLESELDE